jgi:RNA polymerase sigma factor (sigma-70 family)
VGSTRQLPPDTLASADDPLAREFLRGEAGAVARIQDMIVRTVKFRGYYIPHEESRDIVQEVLLEVYQALSGPGLRFKEGLSAFVRAVTYRRCVDWMRHHRTHDPLDPLTPDGTTHPDQSAVAQEQRRLALEVIRELPEACRQLIGLHAGARLTYREISALLGRSEGALRTQMCECLKEARVALQRKLSGSSPGEGGVRNTR